MKIFFAALIALVACNAYAGCPNGICSLNRTRTVERTVERTIESPTVEYVASTVATPAATVISADCCSSETPAVCNGCRETVTKTVTRSRCRSYRRCR